MTILERYSRDPKNAGIIERYIEGGAGGGSTVAWNEEAWRSFAIVPRVLTDVTNVDASWTLWGQRFSSPILVGPSGGHGFFDAGAERATASAARASGSLLGLGQGSTAPIDEVARISGPFLQQLYLPPDRASVLPLVHRARENGTLGFLLTVDNPGTTGHQSFRTDAGSLLRDLHSSTSIIGGYAADVTPADIAWLREVSGLPVIVKGILDPRDARIAVDAGAAGVVVSNHGGRQIDRSVTAADVLPTVRDAVGAGTLVLADGGIRDAGDVFVALALGADAVLLGRPVLRALRAGGETELTRFLRTLGAEFMQLLGAAGRANLGEIGRDAVVHRSVLASQTIPIHTEERRRS